MTPDRTHDFTRGEQRLAAEIALALHQQLDVPVDVRKRGMLMLRMIALKP